MRQRFLALIPPDQFYTIISRWVNRAQKGQTTTYNLQKTQLVAHFPPVKLNFVDSIDIFYTVYPIDAVDMVLLLTWFSVLTWFTLLT